MFYRNILHVVTVLSLHSARNVTHFSLNFYRNKKFQNAILRISTTMVVAMLVMHMADN